MNVFFGDYVQIDGWEAGSGPTKIGEGTKIWSFANVQRGARIGRDVVIGSGVHIGRDVIVGNGCKIQNGAQLFEGVTLEDDVFIGPHAVFTNVLTPRAFQKAAEFKKTLIKKGVSIGANATILCGITIGEYAQVGAGTVVTKDVEAHTRVIGVPARASCKICICGQVMPRPIYGDLGQMAKPIELSCKDCGRRYAYTARDNTFKEITDAAT